MALSSTFEADFASFVAQCDAAAAALAGVAKAGEQLKSSAAGLDATLDGSKAKGLNSELTKTHDTMSQLGGVARATAAAFGVTFSVQAVIGFWQEVVRTADVLVNAADAAGMTVEQTQRLAAVAATAGVGVDGLASASVRLEKALETVKGQTAIEDLGIDFVELRAALPYDRLLMIADALGQVDNASERNRKSIALFGNEGAKLATILDENLRAKLDGVKVASDDAARAVAQLGNDFQGLNIFSKAAAVEGLGSFLLAAQQVKELGLGGTLKAIWDNAMAGGGSEQLVVALRNAQIELNKTAAAAKKVFGPELVTEWDPTKGPQPGNPFDTTPTDREAMGAAYTKMLSEEATAAKALADALEEVDAARKGTAAILAELGEQTVTAIQADLDLKLGQDTLAKAYGLTKAEIKAVAEAYDVEKKALRTVVDAYQDFYREREDRSNTATERERANVERWAIDQKQKMRDAGITAAQYYEDIDDVAAQKLAAVGVNWDVLKDHTAASLRDTADRARATWQEAATHSDVYSKAFIAARAAEATAAEVAFHKGTDDGNKMYAAWLEGEAKYAAAVAEHDTARESSQQKSFEADRAAIDQQVAYAQAYGVSMQEAANALGVSSSAAKPAVDSVTDGLKQGAAAAREMGVALVDLGSKNKTAWESIAAGNALMDAYREAGIATGVQTAMGGYNFSLQKKSGVMPTYGATELPGAGQAWGNQSKSLTVNVNGTTSQDRADGKGIASQLVDEMRYSGVRF